MDNQLLTELKQYCFALYIGQKVKPAQRDTFFNLTVIDFGRENDIRIPTAINLKCSLQLRSLSSITEQEAIEVAKINGWDLYPVNKVKLINIGRNDVLKLSHDWHLSLFAYQYLQQQGFALPIYFKGVQYSVERLIELGIYGELNRN